MSKPHNTHYMYTYIHTDYTYTHTYLQTNTYIHQYMHVHTDTPHPPTGGRGILYIHTYILTYKYIHTYIHACTYRHAPPTHRGGRGEDHLSPLHTKTCAPRPFGGGWGVGPADLDHIYNFIIQYTYINAFISSISHKSRPHRASCFSMLRFFRTVGATSSASEPLPERLRFAARSCCSRGTTRRIIQARPKSSRSKCFKARRSETFKSWPFTSTWSS